VFCACDDDFLNRVPKSSITAEGFFKSASDLELYVNGLANDLQDGGSWNDYESDNVTIRQGSEPYAGLLYGTLSPDNIEGSSLHYWTKDNWKRLRSVNLMLNSLDDVSGDPADINHWVGIAHFFRAQIYINFVKRYSDVPWYDGVIASNEEEMLYKTQDSRELVVGHIMEDLEFAVANIKPDMGNRTRIHRYAALALLARFTLYEGTYRMYHDELGLASTANSLLERAASAAREIMDSGEFEITGNGTNETIDEGLRIEGSKGFRALFSSKVELGSNREMIQWAEYGRLPIYRSHPADGLASSSRDYSLNRSLQESFLTRDGRPYSSVPDYNRKKYTEVFADRDPRMAETFIWPGIYDEDAVGTISYINPWPSRGGYAQGKFFCRYSDVDSKIGSGLGQYTSLPVFRLGEILLIYAEAKAELGDLTGDDINRSINLLRNRVGMPSFDVNREVDDNLRALYPGVSDLIRAVRRERRVELAGEGFRHDDIYRWKVGKAVYEAASSQQGIYVGPELPYIYDQNNDGAPDRGIAATADNHPVDGITWYDLDDETITFYIDSDGFIRSKENGARNFVEPAYYYVPLPKGQITLNPNLKQPYGW
jgi:hypothetical protein